jgi:hypothetical protein
MSKPDLSLDIDDAVHAIKVHDRDGGLQVPVNPLGASDSGPDTIAITKRSSRENAHSSHRSASKHLPSKP